MMKKKKIEETAKDRRRMGKMIKVTTSRIMGLWVKLVKRLLNCLFKM